MLASEALVVELLLDLILCFRRRLLVRRSSQSLDCTACTSRPFATLSLHNDPP
jgi:hypothetical protein